MANIKVGDMIDQFGNWDWSRFAPMLQPDIILRIVAVQPSAVSLGYDMLLWGDSKSGRYTLKEAYNTLSRDKWEANDHHMWSRLWKTKLPRRVRQFVCITIKGSLLTNSERCQRRMANDMTCPFCGCSQETSLHVLRDCLFAQSIYSQMAVPSQLQSLFFILDLIIWLLHNIVDNGDTDVQETKWKTFFGLLCCTIWKSGNKMLLRNGYGCILWSNSDALIIARNRGYRNVEVEMDCIKALKLVAGNSVDQALSLFVEGPASSSVTPEPLLSAESPFSPSLVANEDFQHILRVLNTNVDGKQKIMFALTSIKGIGRRFANIVCKKADVDMNKRAGELTAQELDNLMTIVANPRQFKIPDWFLNRQKDYKDGKYSQVVSNALDMKLRDDLERLKKIRNHRGLRHYWGLRVRGQHTKTTGRRGKTVGVSKKR
ncbi:hypothetical protein GOBAR_DD16367 [Gossypium barbadense]|nr:hypothetical protein GOBAR_DD16367 [Gossypium barbadense]